jgi:hypothetical protein
MNDQMDIDYWVNVSRIMKTPHRKFRLSRYGITLQYAVDRNIGFHIEFSNDNNDYNMNH